MTPERWRRVKEILDAALAFPVAERRDLLEQACGGDAALLRDVESFLAFDDEVEDFIEQPLWNPHASAPDGNGGGAEPDSGRRVGPYRIERLLGRGGMGAVYLAVREDDFEQRVALKLLDRGLDSGDLVHRFHTERQILARLEHPNIARLLDGGATDDGLPYFVMEYVEGEPIDEYCDRLRLPLRARLQLFRKICSAVHVAHQNLVVHRDLKPSNILVTNDGVPKLLDFGIAKLLQPNLAAQVTMPGHGPMTPNYASPEQLLGDPLTTASDVYALGVLLYRLLTGYAPYRLEDSSYAKMVNVICLTEPPRPSAAVRRREEKTGPTIGTFVDLPAELADEPRDAAEARRLGRRLSGDLDAIVMKAMRKEAGRRYRSAEQLSEDVYRHLTGLPVLARKGTVAYRAGKFARRHTFGLVVLLMILGFSITTTVLWRQAVEERGEAVLQTTRAERVTGLLKELFTSADPNAAKGEAVTVREVLDRGRDRIAVELAGEPEVQAEMFGTMGNVYRNLGLYEDARKLFELALETRRRSDPTARIELAVDINNLASLLHDTGQYEEAERYLREALTLGRQMDQEKAEIAKLINNLASFLVHQGRYAEAAPLFEEALTILRATYGQADPNVGNSLYKFGTLYHLQGELDQAEPLLRQAYEILLASYGPQHSQVASALTSLGRVLQAKGSYAEAEGFFRQALEIRRMLFGDEHPHVAITKKDVASVLVARGDLETAGPFLQQALETLRRTQAEDDWKIAEAESVLGAYLTAQGRYGEAEPLLVESYHVLREVKGDTSIYARNAVRRVVDLYKSWGKLDRAQQYEPLSGER